MASTYKDFIYPRVSRRIMVDLSPLSGISWGTVFVSIGSSAAVNYLGITHELRGIRNREIEREQEIWYNKVVSLGLRLRREALRLPYNKEVNNEGQEMTSGEINIMPIRKTIDELYSVHTEAPPEIDKEVLNSIEELGYWFDNLGSEAEGITSTDVKDGLQEKSESLIISAVEKSERYSEIPY